MLKTTRQFINDRQPFCETELKVVAVKKIGGGRANACSDNAIDNSENMDDVRSVTGWLVHSFNAFTNSTDIAQHWWNIDSKGNYFDTTPEIEAGCEYLLDMDLIRFVHKNFDAIESIVALSLIVTDGRYSAVESDASSRIGFKKIEIKSLDTKHLYKLD